MYTSAAAAFAAVSAEDAEWFTSWPQLAAGTNLLFGSKAKD